MHYGRTVLELVIAQALILAALWLVPVDLIASLGGVSAGLIASAIAGVVGSALYLRHRGRGARELNRKLQTLRHSPAA